MSNETNETIEDIVAEIRRVAHNVAVADANTINGWRPAAFLSMLADRIEAAHKRETADEKRISDAVVQSLRDKKLEMAGEIAAKDNEIARLRAALKPVLDCKVMGAVTAEIEPGKSEYCAAIIEKAQRFYYEG